MVPSPRFGVTVAALSLSLLATACGSEPADGADDDVTVVPERIALLDGGEIEVGAGRPVVVAFVAEWCTPCRRELPMIESVYQNHIDDIDVVAVGFQEEESATRSLAADTGVTFDLGADPEGEMFRDFGFVQLPATVVVGPDGEIVESFAAGVDDEELEAALAPIL